MSSSFALPSVFCFLAWSLAGCHSGDSQIPPTVEFTQVPETALGGESRMETIAGRANGATAGQRVVLFAKSGTWWVQPFASGPFTAVEKDSSWKTTTHMGTQYAALLVEPGYSPPSVADALPAQGGAVVVVAIVAGKQSQAMASPSKTGQDGAASNGSTN